MVALADYKMIPSLAYFSRSLICSILFLIDEYNNDRLGEWGFSFSFSLSRIMVLMLRLQKRMVHGVCVQIIENSTKLPSKISFLSMPLLNY